MRKKLLLSGLFLLLCFLQTMAQQRTVTGTVKSSDGVPLEGASVIVVGEKTGVRSDVNGSFSINVPANAKELEITIPTSERKIFEAPLPDDFRSWIED